MQKISILTVDDHELVRATWELILGFIPAFTMVAGCGTAAEAIALARERLPDIILLDITLPDMDGREALPRLLEASPSSKILGISMHTHPNFVRQMIQNGASGYLSKTSPGRELVHAIKELSAGRKYICTEIRNIIAAQRIHEIEAAKKSINALSGIELQIINLVQKGFPPEQIAQNLSISINMLEEYQNTLFKKLNLNNTEALINYISQGSGKG